MSIITSCNDGRCLGTSDNTGPEDSIYFMFVALTIGAVITVLLEVWDSKLPYTVVMFICGLLFGCFQDSQSTNIFLHSMSQWKHMDPLLILYIFVPGAVFYCVANLDLYHIRGNIFQGILLAGPGACYCTFLMGWFVFGKCLPYPVDWNFDLSLMFAGIICATDPVAVIAILTNTAKSSLTRVTYTISFESILNDAAALVIFHVFLPGITLHSHPTSIVLIIGFLMKVIIVSPLIGSLIGIISVLFTILVERVQGPGHTAPLFSAGIIQLVIPLCCAYLSFFVAEKYCQVSGILSCCCAGTIYNDTMTAVKIFF